MLILNRKVGEKIVVRVPECGVVFEIKVAELREGKVKLGFIADDRVLIDREEVFLDKINNPRS